MVRVAMLEYESQQFYELLSTPTDVRIFEALRLFAVFDVHLFGCVLYIM